MTRRERTSCAPHGLGMLARSIEWADNDGSIRGTVMADAQRTLLELFYGRWRSQTLHAGVELGVFEVTRSDPLGSDQIARDLGIDSALGYRLLRALAALGVLCEHGSRSFSSNDAGRMLRADHPQSMRDAFLLREGPEHTAVWKHLADIVRDGQQTGFVREYGMTAFAYADRESSYGEAFSAGMNSQSNLQTVWTIEALRTCGLESVRHLCDVGGGRGHLLCHLLAAKPEMRGTVLERSQVVGQGGAAWAETLRVADRCAFEAGDMFAAVPAADAYSLKMILHDWDDAECTAILAVLRRFAVRPARVFIVEHVIPDPGGPDYAALFDMHMMCWGTGRERTVAEYRRLLEAAGWSFKAVWFPPSGAIGVIEGGLAA